MIRLQPVLVPSAREAEAQLGYDRVEGILIARGSGESITPLVDDTGVTGIALNGGGWPLVSQPGPNHLDLALDQAGPGQFGEGGIHVDEATSFPGVIGIHQEFDRYVDEIGITVMMLPVGEGEVQSLRYQVDIVAAVVAKFSQVVVLKHLENLGHYRALTPGPAGEDLVVPLGN